MQATAQHRVLADVLTANLGVTERVNRLALDAILISSGVLLVALCAQFAVKIPTTTVPITGQTFSVLLAGGALGSKRGGLSMAIYMLLGMLSVPVFAPGSGIMEERTFFFLLPWSGSDGLVWSMASGGYIVGFIFAAYLVGLLAERGWDRRSTVPFAMLLGNIVIYLVGLPWLAVHIANNDGLYSYFQAQGGANVVDMTLRGGLYPFIGGDAIKLVLAAMAVPGAWALIDRLKRRGTE